MTGQNKFCWCQVCVLSTSTQYSAVFILSSINTDNIWHDIWIPLICLGPWILVDQHQPFVTETLPVISMQVCSAWKVWNIWCSLFKVDFKSINANDFRMDQYCRQCVHVEMHIGKFMLREILLKNISFVMRQMICDFSKCLYFTVI